LLAAVQNGSDSKARADMLYASYFAGVALHAGIGLAHMIAQPIGGLLNIPHGDACSIFLPLAMEFNLETSMGKYCKIARALGLDAQSDSIAYAQSAVDKVREIIKSVNAPASLKPYLKGEALNFEEAVPFIHKATGHIKSNPKTVDDIVIKETLVRAIEAQI